MGVERLVSTINWSFSGSMLIYQRVSPVLDSCTVTKFDSDSTHLYAFVAPCIFVFCVVQRNHAMDSAGPAIDVSQFFARLTIDVSWYLHNPSLLNSRIPSPIHVISTPILWSQIWDRKPLHPFLVAGGPNRGWDNLNRFTLWLFNIAMENGPFIDDFPIKTSIYEGFSMAMLNNQMVICMMIYPPYILVLQPHENWPINFDKPHQLIQQDVWLQLLFKKSLINQIYPPYIHGIMLSRP